MLKRLISSETGLYTSEYSEVKNEFKELIFPFIKKYADNNYDLSDLEHIIAGTLRYELAKMTAYRNKL